MTTRTAVATDDPSLRALVKAAVEWRTNVVIGGPAKYSRALAKAVDKLDPAVLAYLLNGEQP